jgi:hypothetical protein
MNYMRVHWVHQDPRQPICLLSELDCKRWETRKIEIFSDGSKGYVSKTEDIGGTVLGDQPVPTLGEIAADPQFIPEVITVSEFEAEWSARRVRTD